MHIKTLKVFHIPKSFVDVQPEEKKKEKFFFSPHRYWLLPIVQLGNLLRTIQSVVQEHSNPEQHRIRGPLI